MEQQAFGDGFVIYDAVKGKADEGLTHYAITLRSLSGEDGVDCAARAKGAP